MTVEKKSFKDAISTVDSSGKRIWVYPKKPKGFYTQWRKYLSYFFLAFLFLAPWIKVNGDPILLFNILKQHFIIFGIHFAPQDMYIFAVGMIAFFVFIVLFTLLFGRIFCGWICPQTIFMEMVFRRIEYAIEGDYTKQIKLNKAPWTTDKYLKKISKHLIYFMIAILIANTFLSYIIGVDEVMKIIKEPISQHQGGFIAMLVFSAIFYYVFAFFREQVCTTVCPYGRLQGVLLVKESIVVIYDWIRGEPRGKRKKSVDQSSMGDCVDCNLCVKVCPTGIDIRNGTQMECVNCTACIDACDEVMLKVGLPTGLIRFDSEAAIETGTKPNIMPKVYSYSGIMIILFGLLGYLTFSRSDVEIQVYRTPGMLYQMTDDGKVSNLYNYQFLNKTSDTITDIQLVLEDQIGDIMLVGSLQKLLPRSTNEGAFFIHIAPDKLRSRKQSISVAIKTGDNTLDHIKTNFLGPTK